MKPLSNVQQKVFSRLRDYQRRYGQLPDLSGLARDMGMHYVSLKQHLEALSKKGYLTFESRGRGRSPFVALPSEHVGVPVIGNIPAGPLSEAISDAEGFLPIPGYFDKHFALRVKGDSMADLIQDGDVVLFKRSPSLERSGQMCAVRFDESDSTLKYVDKLEGNMYRLRPHNADFPIVEVHGRELQIDGTYIGLLRGEVLGALLEDRQVN